MGVLGTISNTFSSTVQVTVRTVGAPFDITMNSDSTLNYITEAINSFDGSTGFWFQSTPFSGTITAIGTNQNIGTNPGWININGEKNEFIFEIQLGGIVDIQQAAGEYLGNIDFSINLTY